MTTSSEQPAVDEILFCVSGSISAISVPMIILRMLDRRVAARVSVALSENGRRFVSEEALAVLSRQACIVDVHADAERGHPSHVELAHRCAVGIVIPATANLIAKLAHGIVDDTLSLVLSVFDKPVVIFPALHPTTLRKPAVKRNIQQLRDDGYIIFEPVDGYSISEGRRGLGPGAIPDPDVVAAYLEHWLRFGEIPRLDGRQDRASVPSPKQEE